MTQWDNVRHCRCGTRLARTNHGTECGSCRRITTAHSVRPPAVRPEFWQEPAMQTALASRSIGAVIRAFRQHPTHARDISQEAVAAWLGISQPRLSRVENGAPIIKITTLVEWARILGIPADLQWCAPPPPAMTRSGEDLPAALRNTIVTADERDGMSMPDRQPSLLGGASGAPLESSSSGATTVQLASDETLSPSVEVEAVLVTAADESARFLELAESTNVGELTVEQLRTDMHRITHAYLKVPTLPLFARTRALRDRAFTLLAGRQRPQQTRDLYVAAGWALTVLAWMSVDLGRPDAAEDHARAAWACATNADHPGLQAWVRATQHTAAFWQDDYLKAARYAEDGRQYATGTAATFLASAQALDLARAGRAQSARLALRQAQDVAQTAEPDPDELDGPFTCSVDRAGSLWSDTYLALGDTNACLDIAQQAVARFEAAPDEARNLGSERMLRIQVVKAHLASGELEGAAEALAPVLATSPEHRVRPLLHRVREVGTMVASAGRSDTSIASAMLDGVAEFGRHPVVTELTG